MILTRGTKGPWTLRLTTLFSGEWEGVYPELSGESLRDLEHLQPIVAPSPSGVEG